MHKTGIAILNWHNKTVVNVFIYYGYILIQSLYLISLQLLWTFSRNNPLRIIRRQLIMQEVFIEILCFFY